MCKGRIWPIVFWPCTTKSVLPLEFRRLCGVTHSAAGAQTWAQNLATTGNFAHDPNAPSGVGENIAGFYPSRGVSAPGQGQSLWVDEKKDWHGGVLTPENWYPTGHYTQMVWKNTQEVGCGTASGDGHPFNILVCRYSPPGNFMGQAPY